jgi:transcriptional regulator with XRE-family HTH domain
MPGTLIRKRRVELGLSQRALARRAGTTQAAVSRLERELTSPRWETVRAMLLAMGCEPDLRAKRLRARSDPVHLASLRKRTAPERLAISLAANRLAARLREGGRRAPR